jgi:serine O-acetyltransferase
MDKEWGLGRLIRSDLDRYRETYELRGQPYRPIKVALESLLFKAGFQAVLLYRLSHWLHRRGLTYLAWATSRLNLFLTGAEIEFNAQFGPGLCIAHPSGIMIGRGTTGGSHVTLFQGVSFGVKDWHPENIRRFPEIGSHCTFFSHSAVYGGVRVGDSCIVAGHSVVVADMPEGSLAVGIPAKVIPGRGRQSLTAWRTAASA